MASLLGRLVGAATPKAPPAKQPVPYVSQRSTTGSAFAASGSSGHLARMGQVGTLFAVVGRLAEATAAVEWDLYRKARRGQQVQDDQRQIIEPEQHAAAALWARPNPFMSTADLVETCQQHGELVGEFFIVITRMGGIPVELWPVRPDRMIEVPHPKKYLERWDYRTPDGELVPLKVEEVIHVRTTPNPENFYRGMGRIAALIRDLDGSTAAAEWNANFFRNSAQPGGLIEIEGSLSDSEFDELRMRWNEQHRGVSNAHRVAILEHGQWKDRAFSMRDMQFTELRNVGRDQIMETYGMSRATMGITDGVNFAAAKAAKGQFGELLLDPRLARWKRALNTKLLPLFGSAGEQTEFDYESPVEGDPEQENAERDSKVQAVATLVAAGWNPTAAAEAYGLPEIAYGDGEEVDPDRDLMIKLVTAAPAALAPWLLPVLLPDVEFPDVPGAVTPAQEDAPADAGDPPDPAEDEDGDPAGSGGDEDDEAEPPAGDSKDGTSEQPPGARNATGGSAPGSVSRETSLRALGWPPARDAYLAGFAPYLDAAERPDLSELDEAYHKAHDAIMKRWPSITAEQGRELREQIKALLEAGDVEGLANLAADTTEAAAAIEEGMGAVAQIAATAAAIEALDAGADTVAAAATSALRLDVTSRIVALLLGDELATAAGREALRLYSPDESAAQIAGAVEAHLRERGDTSARAQVGGALTGAANEARVQTFLSAPSGSLYATEQLDGNTCKFCAEIDGRFICTTDDLSAYRRLYTLTGGYANCAGGVRCRGSVTGAWRPKQAPEDQRPGIGVGEDDS